VAILAFSLVAHILIHDQGKLARCLSISPLVFLGEISYGLYLFHQVVRATTKSLFHVGYGPGFESQERWLFVPDFLVSVLLCALLFRFYEKPLIRWSRRKVEQLHKTVAVSVA
jgi:peptidoglycan/LPS O-acetylase OafA/YrhL